MSIDQETVSVYDARAGEYARMFRTAEPGRHLRAFLAALPPGGRLLDLGCGPGASAAIMAAAGHPVDAWDASAEMVALAAREPGVSARQASFDDLTEKDAYAGIWANFSLLHAPRDRMDAHLGAIARALTPGGLLHIGMKTGAGTKRDGIGRQYTFYTRPDLRDRLIRAGLTPVAESTGEDRGLAGTLDPWIILQARKHG